MRFDSTIERPPPRRPERAGSREHDRDPHLTRARNAAAHQFTQRAGAPLDAHTREEMSERFGYDFSGVRVHSDERAAASARGLDALAYAYGSHIVFGSGHYAPTTAAGKQLLAHELAHVVQQDADVVGAERASAETSTLEREAGHAATSVRGGGKPRVAHRASAGIALREAKPAPPAPAKPQRQEWLNVGREKNLDAELDRSAGWLTFKMRVKFIQDDSVEPWPSVARFTQFQQAFCRTVQERWSFKHFLVPKSPCPDEPQHAVVRVQVTPVTSGEHSTARVTYTSTDKQSSAWGKAANLDVRDTGRRSDIPQTPGEHEFGHMLGLNHIHCARNADECYGVGREEKADILGKGSYVSPRDYEVFSEIMSTITGCPYVVQAASTIPTSRAPDIGGAVGALVGGSLLGLAGMAIGAALGPVGALVGGLIGVIGGGIAGYFGGRAIATPEVPS
jgi:hypothetical protein